MKNLSLIAVAIFLCTSLYPGDAVVISTDNSTASEVKDSILKDWNFNILIEERIFSDKTSQTLLKIQTDKAIIDKLSFFGGIWLRDTLPVYTEHSHLTGQSQYINYIDIYAGLNYDLHQYFNLYFFFEEYIDRGHETNQNGSFLCYGFSGTLYNEGKHNISYFTEWYTTLNTYDLDNWRLWGTETAMKYKYNIYKQTQLYIQAVWNTDSDEEGYGVPGYSDGIYSTRLGIQVNF